MRSLKKGFTMIELLIVIAVLGVLAVAVLSAINPIEQINRGRDTGSRSDSEQLLGAIDRYNAAQGMFPWQTEVGEDLETGNPDIAWDDVADVEDSTDLLTNLESTEEVKQAFGSRIVASNYNPIYLYFNDEVAGASVYACFAPQSKSFQEEAAKDCDVDEVNKPGNSDFPGDDACKYKDGTVDKDNYLCIP